MKINYFLKLLKESSEFGIDSNPDLSNGLGFPCPTDLDQLTEVKVTRPLNTSELILIYSFHNAISQDRFNAVIYVHGYYLNIDVCTWRGVVENVASMLIQLDNLGASPVNLRYLPRVLTHRIMFKDEYDTTFSLKVRGDWSIKHNDVVREYAATDNYMSLDTWCKEEATVVVHNSGLREQTIYLSNRIYPEVTYLIQPVLGNNDFSFNPTTFIEKICPVNVQSILIVNYLVHTDKNPSNITLKPDVQTALNYINELYNTNAGINTSDVVTLYELIAEYGHNYLDIIRTMPRIHQIESQVVRHLEVILIEKERSCFSVGYHTREISKIVAKHTTIDEYGIAVFDVEAVYNDIKHLNCLKDVDTHTFIFGRDEQTFIY